ncbi:chlorophyll synthase, chloroplastic-like [Ipomoea triloba]|uniref:chlorophyll synthase, chloroplastic-like n=1 Tax=Ipomoea triloba TaxID=35885 RepID=UPI00125DA902|nr:chlorophyll synthase, chloroplastic-like [Ipomoea triloba]
MASLLNTVPSIRLSSFKCNPLRAPHLSYPISLTPSRSRFVVRATETDSEVKAKVPDKAPPESGSSINQILGIKGAKQETDKWKIRVQLTKPVTWPPLVWGVVCGAAASGNFHWTPEDVAKSIVCMLMSGPFLTGYTQTINDWYDREIDAINEPYRPIPSGAISENEVITQIWVLLLGGLALGGLLDVWAGHDVPVIFYLAVGGSLLSYIYSAPPLKLKQNGWIGNFALGSSYISLPWWAGQALFGTLTPDVIVLTLLYSIAGLGIAIVNDFKSIEGDRAMGLQSLPVAFGSETAKWICVGAIDITQLSVAGYLFSVGKPYYALALLGLTAPQIFFQFKYFLKDPVKYDVKYQASAQPFLVLGLLVTALATSH